MRLTKFKTTHLQEIRRRKRREPLTQIDCFVLEGKGGEGSKHIVAHAFKSGVRPKAPILRA